MNRKLFTEGGPHNIEDLGHDKYRMSISLPTDADGRIGRECPRDECSPRYFKVKPGTGLVGQAEAYCPYCRHAEDPQNFKTHEQIRFAKDIMMREAQKGVEGMIRDALGLNAAGRRKLTGGLIKMEMRLTSSPPPPVFPPAEDELSRELICPHCQLDHTVFGLAFWCPDCGRDIFLVHVAAELAVTGAMASDAQRRESTLGRRVAAKDLENCLEDIVSIFEAALKSIVRRALAARGETAEEIEVRSKRIGNAFQSISRTKQVLEDLFGATIGPVPDWDNLAQAFERRHPVTHNLGVVDRKYLDRARASELEGRELRITVEEIDALIPAVQAAIGFVHTRLIQSE